MTKPLIIVIIVAALSGCSLYSKPKVPVMPIPAQLKYANKFTTTAIPDQWWLAYHDTNLNQLVALALKNNLDYQLALKNILIARTYITQKQADLFPTLLLNAGISKNASATTTNRFNPPLYNLYQLNASAAYEVDLWHRVANSIKQAQTTVKASQADSDVIKLNLISNIVTTYWQIVALDNNLHNLSLQLAATKAQANLSQDQYSGGLVNAEPVIDYQTQLETINSTVNSTQKQRQTLINTLAYLVGTYPEKFMSKFSSVLPNIQIPAGIAAKILLNRPDIQSAAYQLLAYDYAQKQALSAFFPTFNLTGTYGFASYFLSTFTSAPAMMWNLGGQSVQTLFNFGRITGAYRRSKLTYEAALLTYNNTIINAFTETNNALVAYQQDYLSLKAIERSVNLAKTKVNLAKAKYHAGMINYSNYLVYQLNFLQSNYSLINQQQILNADIVQVYKTLGLGLS